MFYSYWNDDRLVSMISSLFCASFERVQPLDTVRKGNIMSEMLSISRIDGILYQNDRADIIFAFDWFKFNLY